MVGSTLGWTFPPSWAGRVSALPEEKTPPMPPLRSRCRTSDSTRVARWLCPLAFALLLTDSGCAEPPCPPSDPAPDLGVAGDMAGDLPKLLDPTSYAGELVIDASFPFGVLRRHPSAVSLVGARWGAHGGPLRTRSAPGGGLRILRARLPLDRLAPLAIDETPLAAPSGLPMPSYLGELVDLPADRALLSYTESGAGFPGEVLLYSRSDAQIVDRAPVNGFYAVATTDSPAGTQIYYSALSGLADRKSPTVDNGLYLSWLCSASHIRPGGDCAPGRKLFGWDGYSGPLALTAANPGDGEGADLFVAASLSRGAVSDVIFGLRTQALGVAPTRLVEIDSGGTASLVSLAPTATAPGWLVAKSFDEYMPRKAVSAYAQAYIRRGDGLEKSGALLPQALQPGPQALGLSLLTDEQGGLYAVIATADGGVLLQLARKE